MLIQTDAIVIKINNVGESDKLVTLLSRDLGIIRAFVRGAKNVKSKALSATELFSYGDFTIYAATDKYIVREVESKQMFFALRGDIEKLALAQYFAQIMLELAPREENADDYLRLLLNSLHFLCRNEKPPMLIKAVVELRTMAMAGYMPDICTCSKCGKAESDTMYFNVRTGQLYCDECAVSGKRISLSVVVAMRYIIYCPFNKVFSFVISDELVPELCEITQNFLLIHSEKKFTTLEFLESLHIEDFNG